MWDTYYIRILWYMFIPFTINFLSFIVYSSYFPQLEEKTEAQERAELATLIIYLTTLVAIIVQELVTCKRTKLSYFTDFWN